MKPEAVISFRDLDVGFRDQGTEHLLLSCFSGTINRGEMLALLGINGSGKTSLIRTLCRLLEPLGGSLRLKGQPMHSYNRQRLAKTIGYVSTGHAYFSNLSIYELVALGRIPHTSWLGNLNSEDRKKIDKALGSTGLTGIQQRKLNQVSDGERQRTMIARTLAQDTELILLDEPTAYLDLRHRYEITDLLHRLTRHPYRKSVCFSTHDLNVAIQYADRFWILQDQSVIEGAPEDLVLDSQISRLAGEAPISFHTESGQFVAAREGSRSISLTGEKGLKREWTRKALERIGYRVREDCNDLPAVSVLNDGDLTLWRLEKNQQLFDFYHIYELTLHLRV